MFFFMPLLLTVAATFHQLFFLFFTRPLYVGLGRLFHMVKADLCSIFMSHDQFKSYGNIFLVFTPHPFMFVLVLFSLLSSSWTRWAVGHSGRWAVAATLSGVDLCDHKWEEVQT